MAQNIIDTKIREAYDTEANWIKYNPVLLSGQLAYSSDKYGKYKIGNGASRWSQLQYVTLGWGDIAGKPSTFSPSAHTHNASQITDIGNASVKYATTAGAANAVAWDNVSGKPTSMKNPYALTLTSSNHFKSIQYDGSSAQTFMISSDLLYGVSDNPISSASENTNKNTRYVKLLDVTCNATWRRINQQFIVALRHASFLLNIHIASTDSMKFSTNDISYIPLSSNNNIEITRFLAGIVHVDSTKDRFELWYKQDQWTSSVGVIPIGRSAETVDVYLNGYHTDISGNITTKPVFATDISIKNNMPVLYNSTGNLVNGTMTQQAITNALATKALKEHTHPVSQVTGLTPSAIGAAPASHTHGQYAPSGHKHGIADIERRTYNFDGRVSPVNRSLFNVARSCKSAFLPPESITVEYTKDNGASWLDYELDDSSKRGLFSMNKASAVYLGKNTGEANVGYGVRITIKATDRYVSFDTFYCWFSTGGHQCVATIERSTKGEPDKFISVVNDVRVSGWSGANEIAFTAGTFGGGDSQLSNFATYRITFMIKSVEPNWVKNASSVTDLRFYGDNCWGSANPMMENDNIYTWDALGNVSFAKDVKAANFIGNVQGNVQGKSTSSDYLHVYDTRNENPMPNDEGFRKNAISFDFKSSSTIGNPIANGHGFAGLMSFAPWSETSGGNGYQMAFGFNAADRTTPRLAIRTADLSATSWNSWYKIYTSADKPTLAELGAAASNHSHSNYATTTNLSLANQRIDAHEKELGVHKTLIDGKASTSHTHEFYATTKHTHNTINDLMSGNPIGISTSTYITPATAGDYDIVVANTSKIGNNKCVVMSKVSFVEHVKNHIIETFPLKAITNSQIDSLASL